MDDMIDKEFMPIENVISKRLWKELITKHHQLARYKMMKIVPGRKFDKFKTGYNEFIPECKDFIVFEFQAHGKLKKNFTIFQCKFKNKCYQIIQCPSKMYDHLRMHTHEQPFVCKCGSQFT